MKSRSSTIRRNAVPWYPLASNTRARSARWGGLISGLAVAALALPVPAEAQRERETERDASSDRGEQRDGPRDGERESGRKGGAREEGARPGSRPDQGRRGPGAAGEARDQPHGDSREGRDSTEARPWLGLAPATVPEALRAHLDLPPGFGIIVEQVVPGAPAARAGVKPYDVLIELDGQRLTTPEHLSTLVRSYESGDSVELVLLRRGNREAFEIELEAGEGPAFRGGAGRDQPRVQIGPKPGNPGVWHFDGQFKVPEVPFLDREGFGKALGDYQEAMRKWMALPPNERGPAPSFRAPRLQPDGHRGDHADRDAPHGDRPDAKPGRPMLPKGKPGGDAKASGITVQPGGAIHVDGSGGIIRMENPKGAIVVSSREGRQHIEIKGPDGELIYEGPYAGDGKNEDLPEEARQLLKNMHFQHLRIQNQGGKVEIRAGGKNTSRVDVSVGGGREHQDRGKGKEKKEGDKPE